MSYPIKPDVVGSSPVMDKGVIFVVCDVIPEFKKKMYPHLSAYKYEMSILENMEINFSLSFYMLFVYE